MDQVVVPLEINPLEVINFICPGAPEVSIVALEFEVATDHKEGAYCPVKLVTVLQPLIDPVSVIGWPAHTTAGVAVAAAATGVGFTAIDLVTDVVHPEALVPVTVNEVLPEGFTVVLPQVAQLIQPTQEGPAAATQL